MVAHLSNDFDMFTSRIPAELNFLCILIYVVLLESDTLLGFKKNDGELVWDRTKVLRQI